MKKLVMDLPEINDYRMVEGLNQLKTNLAFCGKDIKVITMTSSVPNEGKSSISLSLSRTLAESGKKILMVDADLRKSVMAARYHIQGIDKGLSHYLTGQAEVEDIIYETEVEGLCITVAGPLSPDPTSILDSEQFEQFIENVADEVKDLYDIEDDNYYGDCYPDEVYKIKTSIEAKSLRHELKAEEYRDYLEAICQEFDCCARSYLDDLKEELNG